MRFNRASNHSERIRFPVHFSSSFLESGLRRVLAGLTALPPRTGASRELAPLVDPVPVVLLRAELEALPDAQRLASVGRFSVQFASSSQIPWTLQEIGRLREVTFRQAGEGTGRASDIDVYDSRYTHLWVWDSESCAVVGAYRLGCTDAVTAHEGRSGLYTQSLFRYGAPFLRALGPALELGRSFVREEYQKSFAPLMLLWRGIGLYVARNPRYATLFGPVSISNTYRAESRALMVEVLSAGQRSDPLARLVKARSPYRAAGIRRSSLPIRSGDLEALSSAVESLESDGKGIPVLLRQYLRLGGRLIAFAEDPDFGDVIDGLMVCDLRQSDPRVLAKYMGEEGAHGFHLHHSGTGGEYRLAS